MKIALETIACISIGLFCGTAFFIVATNLQEEVPEATFTISGNNGDLELGPAYVEAPWKKLSRLQDESIRMARDEILRLHKALTLHANALYNLRDEMFDMQVMYSPSMIDPSGKARALFISAPLKETE